jgi:hypothetical protein
MEHSSLFKEALSARKDNVCPKTKVRKVLDAHCFLGGAANCTDSRTNE